MKIKVLLMHLVLLINLNAQCDSCHINIPNSTYNEELIFSSGWEAPTYIEFMTAQGATQPLHVQEESITYDFSRTFEIESYNKYDALNRDDVGKGMSLGIVQFNSTHARTLAKELGIKPWMSDKKIKAILRTKKSKQLQDKMFYELYVNPILEITEKKGITDKTIIEFLVDFRINGCPNYIYKRLKATTTLKQLKSWRKARYHKLHKKKPRLYTRRILNHWLKRVDMFQV